MTSCFSPQNQRNTSPAAMAISMKDDVENVLYWEYSLEIAKLRLETNPGDGGELTKYALAILALSSDEDYNGYVKICQEAVSKLKEAVVNDPRNHFSTWLLGKAYTGLGILSFEYEDVKIQFDLAIQCFRKVVDEDPTEKLFMCSLYQSIKAPEKIMQEREDMLLQLFEGQESSASSNAKNQGKFSNDLEARLVPIYSRKISERYYKKNTDDVENLQMLASALLELSQYESASGSMEMLNDAVLKLENALRVDPNDPYTHWTLGKTHTARALLTPEPLMAMQFFKIATQCFQEAVNKDPKTKLFVYSLEKSLKAPKQYLLPRKNELLPQLIDQGSLTSSNVMGFKKEKFGVTWNMTGWIIISIGIVACLGMAGSRGGQPPLR